MNYFKLYYLLNKERLLDRRKEKYQTNQEYRDSIKKGTRIRRILDNFLNIKGGGRKMKLAIVRRKDCYDVVLLTGDDEVADIIAVSDIEYFSDISDFERKYVKPQGIELSEMEGKNE